MYQKKAFNRREQDYAMALRRKLEEAEAMIQQMNTSRARSLALTKLDEALLWANVGIAEAGIQQGYTVVPRNSGFDFDGGLATNADGQQVRAMRAGDVTFDGMKIIPDSVQIHNVLQPGQVVMDVDKLTELVVKAAQKEAATGKDIASNRLAELELMAQAHKDWYYAMMSFIMPDNGKPEAPEEESK